MTLRERPVTPDGPLRPLFAHGVRRDDLGATGVTFTVYLLFADGQGDWPVEVNLLGVDGARTGQPLAASFSLDNPLAFGTVTIDTGIRITRFGYSWITVDLDGETIARVPFHVFELDFDGGST